MIYDTKRFSSIMRELELTPNQIWFCILLLEQDYFKKKEMFKYYSDKHGGFRWLEIKDLEDKNYIVNFSGTEVPKTVGLKATVKGEIKYDTVTDVVILEMLMVTPYFKDKIYIDAELAADELLRVYPSFMMIDGKRVPLKLIGDREKFYQEYGDIINGDILKHKVIIEAATQFKKFADKGKVTGMGLKKFLASRFWEYIGELIDLEQVDGDSTKTL